MIVKVKFPLKIISWHLGLSKYGTKNHSNNVLYKVGIIIILKLMNLTENSVQNTYYINLYLLPILYKSIILLKIELF